MTSPLVNDRVEPQRDSEMYLQRDSAATNVGHNSRARWMRAVEGAVLGVAIWVFVLLLGVPWVFHIGGMDGVIPALIVCGLLGFVGSLRIPVAVAATLAAILVVISYTGIVVRPMLSHIRSDPIPLHADAVMALSAGTNDDGTLSPASMDQLTKAMDLVNRGIAPYLVVSREAYIVNGQVVTSRSDQEQLVSLIPNGMSKLVVAGITHSTHDEAIAARDLIRARGWKHIVLVTSPVHTKRACATFEKVGISLTCVPSSTRAIAVSVLAAPTDRLKAFQLWLYETAGTIWYKHKGWI